MINTYNYRGKSWIDIDHGTPEEIHKLMEEYKINPFVTKELTSITPKARIEFHPNYIYCILHFPVFKHTHTEGKNQEVDFILSKDVVMTTRYDTIDALHKFAKEIETQEILDKSKQNIETHTIFTTILRRLYVSVFEELEYIEDLTEEITGKIFKGKEKEMVMSISEVTRTILDFKRIIDMHQEILNSLKQKGVEFFGKSFEGELENVTADYQKINTTIKSNLEVLHELQQTNNSLVTTEQNETIKKFTIIGAVLLIMSLLVSIYLLF